MQISNNRGTALLEAVPVMLIILSLVLGLMIAFYLFFTRAWIQYQSEQALYCAAEARASFPCRSQLEGKLKKFLPWGRSSVLLQASNNTWTVEVRWGYGQFSFHTLKELTPKHILASKALRW